MTRCKLFLISRRCFQIAGVAGGSVGLADGRQEAMMTTAPMVTTCTVTACCYNNNSQQCHALAIQVGSDHPMCDTYSPMQGMACGAPDANGGVGACKVNDCRFNAHLLCTAPGIIVGVHSGHADCQTYQRR
jgi:hypothetical protein